MARLSRKSILFLSLLFSSQSAGSVDLIEVLLVSHRATLHYFMALTYGPARALAYDRRRGFRAWVGSDDHNGRNFCLARSNAHKHLQALPTMPLCGASTVDAPLQERGKSRKKINCVFFRDRNPPQSGFSTESGQKPLL